MNKTIQASSKTPQVVIDSDTSTVSLTGVLIPEQPSVFFDEITADIHKLYEQNNKITIEFEINYINTAASKHLYNFIVFFRAKPNVEIVWIYQEDDDDILDCGKDFEEMTGVKFSYVVV